MPISKRLLLAKTLAATCVLGGLERLWSRRGVVIWNYHRIGSCAGNPFDDGVYSATAEQLREHVGYLKKNFYLMTMDELVRAAEAGFPAADGPGAMITFDDGYRDNFELALPVLREAGVPATFFIPTAFLENPRLPWWDRIAFIVKKTAETRISPDYPTPMEIDMRSAGRQLAIQRIIAAYKSAPVLDDERFFHSLETAAKVEVDEFGLAGDLFMTWEHVHRLIEAGMNIEGHTHTHPILARLSEAQQREELVESKQILESRLGREVRAVAYPVGSRGAFSEVTKRLGRESGYRVGFSFYGGVNWPGSKDLMDIRRCAVDAPDDFRELRARTTLLSSFGKSLV